MMYYFSAASAFFLSINLPLSLRKVSLYFKVPNKHTNTWNQPCVLRRHVNYPAVAGSSPVIRATRQPPRNGRCRLIRYLRVIVLEWHCQCLIIIVNLLLVQGNRLVRKNTLIFLTNHKPPLTKVQFLSSSLETDAVFFISKGRGEADSKPASTQPSQSQLRLSSGTVTAIAFPDVNHFLQKLKQRSMGAFQSLLSIHQRPL